MDKGYKYLPHLPKTYIHKEIPEKREQINWHIFIQLAEIHFVSGILGYMAKQYQLVDSLEMLQRIGYFYMRNVVLYGRRDFQMQ